jgi:hypothetical protein
MCTIINNSDRVLTDYEQQTIQNAVTEYNVDRVVVVIRDHTIVHVHDADADADVDADSYLFSVDFADSTPIFYLI